jgi:hypothetical protein
MLVLYSGAIAREARLVARYKGLTGRTHCLSKAASKAERSCADENTGPDANTCTTAPHKHETPQQRLYSSHPGDR